MIVVIDSKWISIINYNNNNDNDNIINDKIIIIIVIIIINGQMEWFKL